MACPKLIDPGDSEPVPRRHESDPTRQLCPSCLPRSIVLLRLGFPMRPVEFGWESLA
jgi:hypothetical protein